MTHTTPRAPTRPSVCVYCGSRAGANPSFEREAQKLGRAIAGAGWQLVYGAGDIGLMGAVARSAQAAGGDTFGVIPVHLLEREVGKRDLSRFVVTETMHERKKVMFMNAQAIVVLPGGAGSLDELFEVLTWRQLGLHAKPIFLLDTDGYWQPLLTLLRHVIDQGFADESLMGYLTPVATAEELTRALRAALSARSAVNE
ncbi:MAG: TIGR00730 family Rossman fold protein [Sediminimonas qiaohouensis]|uniref:Cytokinin riboside 5'-monophosphate phosphoribohydrolase n=1 Tax=Sediminimonas qiaohouensis TaxID=552061 RepID=A0A7C9LQG7_9RHOB|nr:TIGR00730 family Rossman fold protein [Sediminimonas qiaohouensis]MTJ05680.1 TIGR00730 family Rossman fold protein [Sediminimonas qiaohouensis]